jgi:hypothetical protein
VQGVGILRKIIKAKRCHGELPFSFSEKAAGRHPLKAMLARLRSSLPKRLFGFVNDVAPGDADIVQIAVGPVAQLLAGA